MVAKLARVLGALGALSAIAAWTAPVRMSASDASEASRRGAVGAVLGSVGKGLVIGASTQLLAGRSVPSWAAVSVSEDSTVATCDQAVSRLVLTAKGPGPPTELFIVGTAHISDVSAALVKDVISTVKPDAIMLELDASRVRIAQREAPPGEASATSNPELSAGAVDVKATPSPGVSSGGVTQAVAKAAPPATKSKNTELEDELMGDAMKKGQSLGQRTLNLAAAAVGKALSGLYKGLDQRGFSSGEEFKVALDEAQRLNAKVILGDQPAKVTLQRLAAAIVNSGTSPSALLSADLGGGSKGDQEGDSAKPPSSLATALAALDFSSNDSLKGVVETLKVRENVREVMGTLKAEVPELYEALVGERDRYMAQVLNGCRGPGYNRVVAVVGIAHADGIEETLLATGDWSRAKSCKI